MIAQNKISLISNEIQKATGKRVPENVIERDYCLSWFLFGLAQSPLRKNLVFKGGTALRRCHYKEYRFSEDLDFSILEDITFSDITKELENIFKYIKTASNITFTLGNIEDPSQNNYTFFLNYIGPIPSKPKDVKVDITFKEKLLFDSISMPIIKTYEHYTDFPIEPTILVYALEEITTEKVCTLTDKSRCEPRDLYDIYCLITEKDIDLDFLMPQIKEKMELKGAKLEDRLDKFDKKENGLKSKWESRLKDQMTDLPNFNEVFKLVKKKFTEAGIRAD